MVGWLEQRPNMHLTVLGEKKAILSGFPPDNLPQGPFLLLSPFPPFPNPLSISSSRIPTPPYKHLSPTLPLPPSIPHHCLRREHRQHLCPKLYREESRYFGEDKATISGVTTQENFSHDTGSIIILLDFGFLVQP